ncbi:MAG: hypothetical protein HS129_15105 [Leptospiraceae bacterium]|nr:hypothetical protein [Leptospiraceae bacterium]
MMTRAEIIKRIIADVIADDEDLDTIEVFGMVYSLQEEEYSFLLPEYVQAIYAMTKWINEEDYKLSHKSWLWQVQKIVKGEYPLENIPESVRDQVKELYYAVKK